MVNQFITLERGEQGDVELVGEGRFGQSGLQSVDVGTRKVFARQCDVHVGKRLVVPLGTRAVEDDLPDGIRIMWVRCLPTSTWWLQSG